MLFLDSETCADNKHERRGEYHGVEPNPEALNQRRVLELKRLYSFEVKEESTEGNLDLKRKEEEEKIERARYKERIGE